MAHFAGMLLGAFFILYSYYAWDCWDNDQPSKWYHFIWPMDLLWRDSYFHSKASNRRVAKVWKTNWVVSVIGMVMGWGTTESILSFLK
jgi:hypothetical protein